MPSELPAHLDAVREAVLGNLPGEPAVSGHEVAELRTALAHGLSSIEAVSSSDAEFHLDRYILPAALRCPASSERDPFEWTAPFAARSLGLPAVSWMTHNARPDVVEAIDAAMAEATSEGKSLGLWLSTVDSPARAAVVAAATSWASRAWLAVPWREIGRVRFNFGPIWHRPLGFYTKVILRGRPDALVLVRGPRAQERVLVTVGWPDRVVTRLDALVVCLDSRRAPLRAVTVHPASGRIDSVEIDHALLTQAVDDVLEAVSGLAPIADGSLLAELPGPHCWYCHRLDECRPGAAWVARQTRRVAGIPLRS